MRLAAGPSRERHTTNASAQPHDVRFNDARASPDGCRLPGPSTSTLSKRRALKRPFGRRRGAESGLLPAFSRKDRARPCRPRRLGLRYEQPRPEERLATFGDPIRARSTIDRFTSNACSIGHPVGERTKAEARSFRHELRIPGGNPREKRGSRGRESRSFGVKPQSRPWAGVSFDMNFRLSFREARCRSCERQRLLSPSSGATARVR